MLTPVDQDWSGGGARSGGSDPKGVNVTAVGLDIRLLYVICYVKGRIQDWKWEGVVGQKLIQFSKLSATDKQTHTQKIT